MRISMISFTLSGLRLEMRLEKIFSQTEERHTVRTATGYRRKDSSPETVRFAEEGLGEWTAGEMSDSDLLIFIGAAGIAVRAIAPFVRDKLKDPAVLAIDEQGRYVIPLLSGHMGGANEAARMIAREIGAIPVITTATDINGVFSADIFAKEHHLRIVNREAIASVSTRAIEGKPVRLCIEGFPPKENDNTDMDVVVARNPVFTRPETLILVPKRYAVGMGCKKGSSFEALEEAFAAALQRCGIREDEVGAVTSIDIKMNEPGLLRMTERHRLPFLTFSAQVLGSLSGDFSASAFVESKVGVDNVCERSAMAAVGAGGRLVLRKTSFPGVTVAVAETRQPEPAADLQVPRDIET